jgi:hypothetical protein
MKWIGAMMTTRQRGEGSQILLITMMKGTTSSKCFEKCQQRIYKMALMPQPFSLPFCARNDFFNDSNRGGKCAWRALEALMEMQTLP